jgi:EpsD family peptidyl-prolyl cis-trans isomerase
MPISPVARHVAALAALSAIVLAGCGEDKKAATQVAARVNKEEISIHQINSVIAQSGNLPPEQLKVASRQVLDRLVDEELLVQGATEKKLDREKKTIQAIEAARRDILARSYMESIASTVAKPSTADVTDFYSKRPELFSERRLYNLQQLSIPGKQADLVAKLEEQIRKAKSLADLAAWLKSQNIPFSGDATTKAAEQLPLELLSRFHQMKDGQFGMLPAQDGVLVVQLVASRSAPLDQKAATPYIEQFLSNQKKIEATNLALKQLHDQAKIEFLGEFVKSEAATKTETEAAAPAASANATAAPAPTEAKATVAAAVATPASTRAATPAAVAAPSVSALEKGAMGLK